MILSEFRSSSRFLIRELSICWSPSTKQTYLLVRATNQPPAVGESLLLFCEPSSASFSPGSILMVQSAERSLRVGAVHRADSWISIGWRLHAPRSMKVAANGRYRTSRCEGFVLIYHLSPGEILPALMQLIDRYHRHCNIRSERSTCSLTGSKVVRRNSSKLTSEKLYETALLKFAVSRHP